MAFMAYSDVMIFEGALEMISVLRTELCLFGMAALIYLVVWSNVAAKPHAKVKGAKGSAVGHGSSTNRKAQPPRRKETSEIQNGTNTSKARVQDSKFASPAESCAATQCAKQIRDFGKEGKLESAVATFDKLKDMARSMKPVFYNSIVDTCVQCNDMALAIKYFAEAKDAKLADVVTYNIVMKGYLASGDTKSAQQLLPEMMSQGLSPSHATYHGLLQISVQQGDQRAAWDCISQMRAAGLQPSSITCSMMLKLVGTSAHSALLKRVLALTTDMDAPVDDVLLCSIVEACLRAQRLDMLADQLQYYRSKEVKYQLSAPTYGSMIKAYGAARDVKQVWFLWQDMQRANVQPSSVTLGCTVDALVMNGCAQDAWNLVQELWNDESQKGLVNTVIYSTIVKGFALSRRLDNALAVYDEMRARAIPCNTITYNTLLNALVRASDLHRLPELLEDMQASSPKVEPDMITYSTIMKGYCSAGDLDKGLALLHDMEKSGEFAPDEVMFNSLLDGCAKERRLNDALALLDKMRAAGVSPSNYTLSIMVKLLGRSKRLGRAFAMVQEVTSQFGFRPNIHVYTCLIQACFHNRDLGKALKLHDEIIKEGCEFDSKAYVSLVRGCLQMGAVDKAAEVVRCACGVPGTGLRRAEGRAPGVEKQCIDEVMSKLRNSGIHGAKAAHQLAADLEARSRGGDAKPKTPAGISPAWRANKIQRPDSAPEHIKRPVTVAPWRRSEEKSGETSTECGSNEPSDESSTGENSDAEGNCVRC